MPYAAERCQATGTVSVVIPAYNYGRYIRDAIENALAQTVPPLDVIVVDDGSTDDTPEVLASFGNRIRTWRTRNQGPAAARNFGVAHARGEYIAFLDADDVWRADKLELQLARFDDSTVGLVHCAYATITKDGREKVAAGGLEGWIATELLELRTAVSCPGSSMMIPRRVFDEVGGFDPTLRVSEDWDLCYRIAARYRVACVNEPLLRYREHSRGLHHNIAWMEEGMLKAFAKVFAAGGPEVQALRSTAYGRLHRILSGSYLHAGELRNAIRHGLLSVRYDPRNFSSIAMAPLKRLVRPR